MTLPRYVAHLRPRSSQIVLEPNVDVIERVRAEAPLPPRSGIKVRPVMGQTGIKEIRDGSQDLVVLDAFDGGVVPDDLTSAAFVAEVRRVLAPGGVFVANLVDRPPYPRMRTFVAVVRELGGLIVAVEPATMKGRREGNMVIACGAVPEHAFGEGSPMAYRVFRGQSVLDAFGGGAAR